MNGLIVLRSAAIFLTLTILLAPVTPARAVGRVAVPVEHWSAANQGASGLITGDGTFEQSGFLKFPSQTLKLSSMGLVRFPANLGVASGNFGHLYRIAAGGTAALPNRNYLCGGGSKVAVRPTYLLVTHFVNKYLPGVRAIEIGIYEGSAKPTGTSADKLCATVGYVADAGKGGSVR